MAREACAEAGIADATLRYWKKNLILNDCPLFKKTRVAYFCEPAAAGDAAPGPPAPVEAGPAAEKPGDDPAY